MGCSGIENVNEGKRGQLHGKLFETIEGTAEKRKKFKKREKGRIAPV